MKRAGFVLLLASLLVPGVAWVLEAKAASSCRQRGGSFNDATGQCDFVLSHERTSFVRRHKLLLAGSAAALVLGVALFARARGGVLLPAARSDAEKLALWLCLFVGVLAILLAVVSVAWGPVRWLSFLGGRRGNGFWTAAILLAVDALLVLAAGRGSRAVAIAAAGLFGVLLVLMAGAATIGAWMGYGLSGGEMPIPYLVEWVAAFGLMAAVQWFCLRALRDRI
jgi:hypothetical protein